MELPSTDAATPDARVRAALVRGRARLWALCYRMTGNRAEADDLCQEALTRAIEKASQAMAEDPTGWMLQLGARVCLNHLRRRKIERRVTELVDPLDLPMLSPGEARPKDAEQSSILREDVRYAVVVALQRLSPRQRAALVLHDVCDQPLDRVADVLGINSNAAKALIHRARLALKKARRRDDGDFPPDAAVVERFAQAVEAGSIERISELLADDVWGSVDGGGVVQAAKKPSFGRVTLSRQWQNAKRRLNQPVTAEIRKLNGESAVVIRLADMPDVVVAIVHFETRDCRVIALRINRDPRRIAWLGVALP